MQKVKKKQLKITVSLDEKSKDVLDKIPRKISASLLMRFWLKTLYCTRKEFIVYKKTDEGRKALDFLAHRYDKSVF
jgi:hypothetical protein